MFTKMFLFRALAGKLPSSTTVARSAVLVGAVLVSWRTGTAGIAAYAAIVQAVVSLVPERKLLTTS